MAEILRLAWPVVAVVVARYSFLLVQHWWRIRRYRKADDEQRVELAPFATGLGATVTSPVGAAAWSAELQGPMASYTHGFLNKLTRRSKPRFDLALDFQRGPWHVRVSQASIAMGIFGRLDRKFEHRIEVATSVLAPMMIARHAQISFRGRVVTRRWSPAPPSTAELSQADWLPLRLPPSVDDEFAVCASDLSTAARSFTLENLEWFLARLDELPVLTHGRHMFLTFESGLVYATFPNSIDPETLMSHVDAIVGLLDRISDARPRHPAVSI
jgi:hypothetical protein